MAKTGQEKVLNQKVLIRWKKKRVAVPVCPLCDRPLSNNNSIPLSFRCYKCNLEYKFLDEPGNLNYYMAIAINENYD